MYVYTYIHLSLSLYIYICMCIYIYIYINNTTYNKLPNNKQRTIHSLANQLTTGRAAAAAAGGANTYTM